VFSPETAASPWTE